MAFRLDKQRATEAAGVLLRCAPNQQMTRLRLLKLMYIADRESLKEKGRPITGDRICAMDHGPVLSGVYDMIKDSHADPHPWPEFIRSEHNDVILIKNPGVGNLSRWEVQKLHDVWTRFEDKSEWYIVHEVVHKFQEYANNKPCPGSSRPIPYRDVIIASGVGDADASRILQEAADEAALDRFWDRVADP